MRPRKPNPNKEAGFTLIEMIASLALLGLLASIFGMGLVAAVESYDFSRSNSQIAQKGQMAMGRMIREISELTQIMNMIGGSDPSIVYDRIEEINGVTTTSRFGLSFDSASRQVRLYENLSGQLDDETIDSTDTGDVLVEGVKDLVLHYFQGTNELSIWPFSEAPATMQITLSLERPDSSGHTQDFTTLIHLRNNGNDGGALR
jgi:prepilin-type N-terminal cleavage/methylation domain-containing protein